MVHPVEAIIRKFTEVTPPTKLPRLPYELGIGHAAQRYLEECRLLKKTRHPNIVQFLGVCFEEGSQFPILVMEFLPTNLTSCLDRYGILLDEISYSILHDVSLGLAYLHGQTPPIIHRDLSANNVLLSTNMDAKISDLGVARILNLTPLQVSRMTETPGTPAYMPPEVMVADPHYDTSVDVFSFGVMIIHTFTAEWPLPKIGQTRIDPTNPDKLIPVTEIERREEFLRKISRDHPLTDLILSCLKNNPQRRPRVEEIVGRTGDMIRQFPSSFENRMEMLQRISTLSSLNTSLELKIAVKKEAISTLTIASELLERDIAEKEAALEDKEMKIKRLGRVCIVQEAEITSKNLKIEEMQREIQQLSEEKRTQKEESESRIERIELAHLASTSQLEVERHQTNSLQEQLKVTDSLLGTKNSKIRALSEQLSRIQQYLTSKLQVCIHKHMGCRLCQK